MIAALELALAIALAPASTTAPAPAPTVGPAGALRGTVIDEVDFLPRQGVTLILGCDCDMEARTTTSGDDGSFAFEGLDPGGYQLTLYGGTGVIEYAYQVAPGEDRALVLAIPPQRLPERDTRGLPVYAGYSHDRKLLASQVELSIGGVLLAGGFMMIVGTVVEATKPQCPQGGDSCGSPPRPGAARGLAFGGAISATAGGVLLGLGAAHRRQYRLGLSAGRDGGGVVFGGRF
jgi:hypothetical protein